MRGVHHRLVVSAANADVVAVEADVDVAERNGLADELGDEVAQARAQHRAATVNPHYRDALATR